MGVAGDWAAVWCRLVALVVADECAAVRRGSSYSGEYVGCSFRRAVRAAGGGAKRLRDSHVCVGAGLVFLAGVAASSTIIVRPGRAPWLVRRRCFYL